MRPIRSKATLVFVFAILLSVGLAFYIYTLNADVINKIKPHPHQNTSVYFFYSHYCPHCREVMPYVEDVAKKVEKKGVSVTFCSVDETMPQSCAKVAKDIHLSAVPTAVVYSNESKTLLVGSDEVRTLGKVLGVEQ